MVLAACGGNGATPTDGPSPGDSNTGGPTAASTVATTMPPDSVTPTQPTTSRATTTSDSPSTAVPQPSTTRSSNGGRLDHPSGFSLEYPDGWAATGPVIATEFGANADCAAVEIVDFEPPTDGGEGQAGYVLHSVVQICAGRVDDLTLDAFMRATYAGSMDDFRPTDIGGLAAFEQVDGADRLAFAQNDEYRFQVLTTVVADPELDARRSEEVTAILATLSFD
jgi:hypothetical protein